MTCLGPSLFPETIQHAGCSNYFTFPYHAAYPEYPLVRLSNAPALVSISSVILQEPERGKKIRRGRRQSVKLSHHGLHSAAQSAQAAPVQIFWSGQLPRFQVHLEAILYKLRDKMFPIVYGVSFPNPFSLGPSRL